MRATIFIVAAVAFFGGRTYTHAQYTFGKAVTDDEKTVPQVPHPSLPMPFPTEEEYVPQGLQGPLAIPVPSQEEHVSQVRQAEQRDIKDEFGLTPPTRMQLFGVHSESVVKEIMRRELPKVKVDFPVDAAPPNEVPGTGLAPFPARVISPVANQVCYRPLYFEDKRTERFGYYFPYAQPFISTALFYGDVIILPYLIAKTPPWTFACDNR